MEASKIIEILKTFCRNKNYRAILIDGKWGIGKTFYFKKFFDSLNNKARKHFHYFSFFGTESIDEINTKIYRELHPRFIWLKVGVKTISSSIDAVSPLNISSSLDYILDLIDIKDINLKKHPILIFDDIERMSNNVFPFFLGFLYKLNLQGARVICFCSSEILKDKFSIFDEHKEKVFDAVYMISEPSLVCFEDMFKEFTLEMERKQLLEYCKKNIRTLRRADALYTKIKNNISIEWNLNPFLVAVACCLVIRIVLDKTQENKATDTPQQDVNLQNNSNEFHQDIEKKYKILMNNYDYFRQENNLIPELCRHILRIYLYDDFSKLSSFITKSEVQERQILDDYFYYLSDKNKIKFVNKFYEKISDPKSQFNEKCIRQFRDILNYYPYKIEDELIETFVKNYFLNVDKENIHNVFEITYLFDIDGSNDENEQINSTKIKINKLLENLYRKYKTDKLIDALKPNESLPNLYLPNQYLTIRSFVEEINKNLLAPSNGDNIKTYIDTDVIKDILLKNNFYICDLSNDINHEIWEFCHAVTKLVFVLGLKDEFIKFARKQVKKNDSLALKDRLEALIFYDLDERINLQS